MKKYQIAILLATVYLLVYVLLFDAGATERVIGALFSLSPLVVIWMVVQVLKHGHYTGKELEDGEEFGYEDRAKETLQFF
jgi:hypothetical protein